MALQGIEVVIPGDGPGEEHVPVRYVLRDGVVVAEDVQDPQLVEELAAGVPLLGGDLGLVRLWASKVGEQPPEPGTYVPEQGLPFLFAVATQFRGSRAGVRWLGEGLNDNVQDEPPDTWEAEGEPEAGGDEADPTGPQD